MEGVSGSFFLCVWVCRVCDLGYPRERERWRDTRHLLGRACEAGEEGRGRGSFFCE